MNTSIKNRLAKLETITRRKRIRDFDIWLQSVQTPDLERLVELCGKQIAGNLTRVEFNELKRILNTAPPLPY